jgi:hypothetical protein
MFVVKFMYGEDLLITIMLHIIVYRIIIYLYLRNINMLCHIFYCLENQQGLLMLEHRQTVSQMG